MPSKEEMIRDIQMLVTTLDIVMDAFFESCRYRDQEVEDVINDMKDKYMRKGVDEGCDM